MNQNPSRPGLGRRGFLRLAAAAGITAAGAYTLAEYAPWLDYTPHAAATWQQAAKQPTVAKDLRELIRCATLAASGHNTQPWRFAVRREAIEIHPDYTRRLPVVDPNDRELWISLGCALENLSVAARTFGYRTEVAYPGADDLIRVQLMPGFPQGGPLFDALPLRQNTRTAYDGQPVKAADLDQVLAMPLEPGVTLLAVTEPAGMAQIAEFVRLGNLQQYGDKAFIDELIHWLRFNQKDALAACDGLYSRCSGNPDVPRWLGQMFVAGGTPEQQATADTEKLRSSPGAFVIAAEADTHAAWVRTGQVYERLALRTTALSIKSALLNQPVEIAGLRTQFQSALGLGTALPQLLVRFGYAAAMPRSLRRSVAEVLI